MSDEIKNPGNQVSRLANGRYYVLWRGVVVSGSGGIREFNSEEAAGAYLARRDAADRVVKLNMDCYRRHLPAPVVV
jgi:hypothetical protein